MGVFIETRETTLSNKEFGNFLPTELLRRDESKRFSAGEKALLAQAMLGAWPSSKELSRGGVEWMIMENGGKYRWGIYPDGERFVHEREEGEMSVPSDGLLYVVANLETTDDVMAIRTAWDEVMAKIILGTTNFPNARGDRPVKLKDGWREMVLLKRMLKDFRRDGVRGLVLFDSHSPALSFYALREGMGVLDLSAIPLMLQYAAGNRLFDKGDWRVVVGDDGASELGMLVSAVSCLPSHIQGVKTKNLVDGKNVTVVRFGDEDLGSLRGKSVIMPEDIISTGGTMEAVINDLERAGVERVVILATYPIFAGEALIRLGNRDGVTIVTTDGRTPLTDINQATNIIRVPIKNLLPGVLKIDQAGINFWSDEGIKALTDLGLCHAPWQVYNRQS